MTISQAKKEIPDIFAFNKFACTNCDNDYYCTVSCSMLDKAKGVPYEVLIDIYALFDGNFYKVFNAIDLYKKIRNKQI